MSEPESKVRSVGIGCDHLGLALKRSLCKHLEAQGLTVTDIGVDGDEPVDYPDIGAALARRLAAARCGSPTSRETSEDPSWSSRAIPWVGYSIRSSALPSRAGSGACRPRSAWERRPG